MRGQPIRHQIIFFFFLLLIAWMRCSWGLDAASGKIHAKILEEINFAYGKELTNDTIYYVESASCLSCQEKFWSSFTMSRKQPKVLLQVDNSRVPIRMIVPDYVANISNVTPIFSNSISKFIDESGNEETGVYLITINQGRISDLRLFMK